MKTLINSPFAAIAILAMACFGGGLASAAPVAAVELGSQSGTSNTNGWAAGFAFTVSSAVNVTHLGKFDHEGDGIVGTDVALYNVATGEKLATASLTAATWELNGSVRAYYASLSSPVALVAGTQYAVYAVVATGEAIRWGKTRTWGGEITLVQGRANSGAALPATYAQTHTLNGDGFFGGTFKYSTGVAAGPVDASTSTVSASPTAVPADGTTSTITVTLKDSGSAPVAGKTVSLAGSPTGATINAVNAITDASGQATFTVSSNTAGTVVFTATDVTDSNLVINDTASVDFQELVVVGPVDAGSSTVVASPSSVAANGTATSTITVTLKDSSGNLIEGEGVTLGGSPAGATISPAAAQTTDANGAATFTVSSTTTGSIVFTAMSVSDSVTITQTASVEFTAPVGGSAINVNFYASNGSAYTTPQSDLVGVASAPGEYWNQFNSTSASPLLDASGAASTVTITDLPTSGWGSNTGAGGYTLLIASRAQFGKGTDTNFTIRGLTAAGHYDLYLYSHNQVSTVSERALGTWSTTNTTSGSSSQVIDARTTLNGTTFQEGVNYVKFTDVEADGSGNIAILGDAADVDDFDSLAYRLHLCGIQIVPQDNDYNSWLTASYPGLGNPEDDDDGDGRTNNYERIYGLNPTDPSSMNLYTVPFDQASGSFSYSRRTQGLTGWTYKVWYSINLVDWFEDTLVQQSPQAPANQIEIVDVVINPELLAQPKLFVKLSAAQDGPAPAAPVLVSSWGSGATATLAFSMPMSESTATNNANYSVVQDGVGPITVTDASLSSDGKSVILTLSAALVLDTPYTVTANNLIGSNGGVLASGTTGQFRTWDNDPNGIKVFILAGQSNMVGYGSVETGKGGVSGAIGSLRYMAVNDTDGVAPHYRDLLDTPSQPATSTWKTRSDVKVWWLDGDPSGSRTFRMGDLKPSFGNQIGPEYGFGQVLGDHFTQPVLIIKTAWGGKSLAVDFRPPGAVATRGGTVGPYYTAIIDDVRDALRNLATDFPEWSGQGYQIAGFGWHQGWADGGSTTWANEYQANLTNLIEDLRVEFGSPDLPVSIADSGFFGVGGQTGNLLTVKQAQDTIGSLVSPHPVYSGTVLAHDTAPHWRDPADSPNATNQPHHWNFNGESYFLIGKGIGDNMVNLLPSP